MAFHEDPDNLSEILSELRDWLKSAPHIIADPDDQTLMAFLRGSKFSLDRAKNRLDAYYTLHTKLPEFFKNRNVKDERFRALVKTFSYFPLEHRDPDGRRVLMVRFQDLDPKLFSLQEFLKMCFMFQDVLIRDDGPYVTRGVVNFIDVSGVPLTLALQFTPALARKTVQCVQNSYPILIKGLHFINMPSYAMPFFIVFKKFLKEKIRNRVFIHGDDREELYKKIPRDLLPVEYGGRGGTMKQINDIWLDKLESFQDFFTQDENFGVDERKRPQIPGGFFSYVGSLLGTSKT